MKCPCDNLKQKKATADLDFIFDWAPETNGRECADGDYLSAGESIDTFILTVPAGLTSHDESKVNLDTAVIVWLAGGTPGKTYTVACEITTTMGRIDTRNLYLTIT